MHGQIAVCGMLTAPSKRKGSGCIKCLIYSFLATLYCAHPCHAPSQEAAINSAQPPHSFINVNQS